MTKRRALLDAPAPAEFTPELRAVETLEELFLQAKYLYDQSCFSPLKQAVFFELAQEILDAAAPAPTPAPSPAPTPAPSPAPTPAPSPAPTPAPPAVR